MQTDLLLAAEIGLQAAEDQGGKPSRLSIVAYSGGWLSSVPSYGTAVIDLAGLQVPPTIPILTDHENKIDAVLGSGRAEVRAGRLLVTAALAASPAADRVRGLLSSGVGLAASVGIRPTKVRSLRAGETISVNGQTLTVPASGATLVLRGYLREVSIVAMGADESASVALAARMELNMDTTTPEEIRAAERERLQAIDAACAGFTGDRVAELRAQAIADEITIDDLKTGILAHLRASRPAAPVGPRGNNTAPANRDVLACAAMIMTGQDASAERAFGADVANRASDLRCRSAMDLCAASLRAVHAEVPTGREELLRAAFSTTSMPSALGLAGEKSLQEAYSALPATWRSWCGTKSVSSFRQHTAIRPNLSNGQYEEVGEGGEIKHAAIGEETYSHRANTYGRLFSITRQTLINDDLGAIFELARELGRQGARTLSDKIYQLLLANTGSFFHANNSNLLTGGGSALAAAGLEAAIKALRERTDAAGLPIGLVPRVLLVPPALEFTARALLKSAELERSQASGDREPRGNPFQDVAVLEVESRLSSTAIHANASSTAWYLFADPAAAPAVVVSFLNAQQTPTLEQVALPGNQLGIGYRAYYDFGADFADSRAGVKSAGA